MPFGCRAGVVHFAHGPYEAAACVEHKQRTGIAIVCDVNAMLRIDGNAVRGVAIFMISRKLRAIPVVNAFVSEIT